MSLNTNTYGYVIDPLFSFCDQGGKTIANGYVRVFRAGTSTPVLTYRNFDGAFNAETIEMDNSGRALTNVIASKGSLYKVCVYDAEHSQEDPILTVDKVAVIGASVNATNIVQGMNDVAGSGWIKSVSADDTAEISLDATNVTSEVDTMVKATAASADYMMPLVHKNGSDPDKKITLGNIFKFVLNFIHSLTDTASEADLVAGNYFALDGSAGTKKLNSTTLLTKTAQNALAGNVAPAFDPTRDNTNPYKSGEIVTYEGKVYTFKVDHYGEWVAADVVVYPSSVTDEDLQDLKKIVYEIANVRQTNNLFDLDSAIDNCFVSRTDGELVSNNLYSTSDYIQVNDNQIYTCYVLKQTYGRTDCIACYDSSKNFIGAAPINSVLIDGNTALVNFYPIKHTQFIRYTVSKSSSKSYKMFVVGDSYPAYYKAFNPASILNFDILARKLVFKGSEDADAIINSIQEYIAGDNLLDLELVTASTFVNTIDGTLTAHTGTGTTDYIQVVEGLTYSCISLKNLYGNNKTTACYDKDKNFIGIASPSAYIDTESETKINFVPLAGTKYVRITINTSDSSNLNKMFVVGDEYPTQYKEPASHKTATRIFVPKENVVGIEGQNYNYLYEKTWYACGDSFTHGDFTNMVDDDENPVSSTDPVIYDSELSMYKTYPWQIGKKNGMHLHNLAVNGGTIKGFYNNIMTTIPTEGVDFVTIAYGINDSASVTLGTINDTYENDTFYGYLNSVIQYFYDNMPFVHLAFIVMPDGMNNDYRTAQEEVCAKYGVPCFNLYKDPRAPMWMYKDGASSGGYNYARYQKMKVKTASGTSNGHPSVYAHEFFSTCIEGFLRDI